MANTYFVASSGSSGNSGLSALLPKQTWAQAMTAASAGDTILGNGGDTFRELVQLTHANMTLGAYGTGRPIITGANVITGWGAAGVGTNTWSVAMSTQTNILFAANVRAVKGSANNTLTNGQWFWASNVCYYRSDAGNPDSIALTIEAGQRNYAIDTNSNDGFTIKNVVAQRANADESGIYCHFQPANYLIDGCLIQDNYGSGVHINGTTSTPGTIQNCTILNNGIYGVWHSHAQCLTQYVLNNRMIGNAWRTDGAADFAGGWNGQVQSGEIAYNLMDGNGAGSQQTTGTAHGIYLNVDVTSCTLLIHHNECRNHPKGNGIKADSSCTIYNNYSHDNVWQGYELGFNTGNNILIVMHHNRGAKNGNAGLAVQHGASGAGTLSVKAYCNTFDENCQSAGQEIAIRSDVLLFDFRDNIVRALPTVQLFDNFVTITGTYTSDYNIWAGGNASPFRYNASNRTFAAYKTASGQDAHSLTTDPALVSP